MRFRTANMSIKALLKNKMIILKRNSIALEMFGCVRLNKLFMLQNLQP